MHPCIVCAILAAGPGYRVVAAEVPVAGRSLFGIRAKKRRTVPAVEPKSIYPNYGP